MSGRKNSDSMPDLPAPLDVAGISVEHSHEKNPDQTPALPLQAPKNALFASGPLWQWLPGDGESWTSTYADIEYK